MKIMPAGRGRPARAVRSLAALTPVLVGLSALAVPAGCGAGGDAPAPAQVAPLAPEGGRSPGVGGPATGGTFVGEDCTGTNCDLASTTANLPGPPGCGNGVRTDDEACDDGNTVSGDGCAGNCLATERGFSCAEPNQPCQRIARCGDGVVAPTEQCDDGNAVSGDGCSDRCRVELGHKCAGTPSVCTDTVCGDGITEGAEACDDGNAEPFDGCSADCLKEPNCQGASCTSECGDGILLGANEECDDGNLIDGDGCSSTCKIENGFKCPVDDSCDQPGANCVLNVPAIFRDFPGAGSANAQPSFGGNDPALCQYLTPGTVQAKLDAAGRPVLNVANTAALTNACLAQNTVATFNQWYTDNPNNVTVVGSIALYSNGQGGYVNRWGPNGEQWSYTKANTERQVQGTCAAGCQNEAQNSQGTFQGMPTLQCNNNCQPQTQAAQQFRNGQFQQLNQQLTQAMAANPPVQATIDMLTAQVAAAQTQLDTLTAAADACLATCQATLATRVAQCLPTCAPCSYDGTLNCVGGVQVKMDGTPLFFPVDGVTGRTSSRNPAKVPEQYGYPSFPLESALFPGAPDHNFYFTTEVEYWFKYTANMRATLTFLGDDDVWVFINGNLAVDLGGVHVPSTGSVTINAPAGTVVSHIQDGRNPATVPANVTLVNRTDNARPGDFGLALDNVYKISIFHVERQLDGSSFQLTLAGFNAQPSNCTAVCGDGVLSFGEECDNGVAANTGGYGKCGSDCKLGPFCGDGNVDVDAGETCDVGPGGDATCRGCREIRLR